MTRGANKGADAYEPMQAGASELLANAGIGRRTWELAVRPDAFLSLHRRDQGDVLGQLAGIPELTVDSLIAAGATSLLRSKRYADHLDGSLAGLYEAEAVIRSDRTEATRASTDARGAYVTAQASAPRYIQAEHEALVVQLEAARSTLEVLQRNRADQESAHRAVRTERASRVSRARAALDACTPTSGADVDELAAEKSALEVKLAAIGSTRPAAEIRSDIAKRGSISRKRTVIEAELATERSMMERDEERASAIQDAQEALGEQEPEPQRPELSAAFANASTLVARADTNDPACYACGAPIDYEALLAQIEEQSAALTAHEED